MNVHQKIAWILIIALLFIGFSNADRIDYLQVTKRLNLGTGSDSLVVSNGTITSNSSWKIKSLITDTNYTPGYIWEVDPSFVYSKYRKTSNTIMGAISNMDSGTVLVHPGLYTERITAKNNVSIVGTDKQHVFLTRTDDTASIYCYNVTNFRLANMTIKASFTASNNSRTAIKLYRCFFDSTDSPTILFDNLLIYSIGSSVDSTFNVIADSSSFKMDNCYLSVYRGNPLQNFVSANIKVRNYSHPIISNTYLYSAGAHSGVKVAHITCRPVVNNCYCDAYLIYSATANATIRDWNNISTFGNNNVDEWLTNNNNKVDANFLLR